jgi:glutamate-1-semialdehyde aminotransferase/spore coat polysaccharide biosynthesis protein SpsF (cytidylyltransferase family)
LEPEHNVVAIVQARMNSSRLPGKVLADVAGRPMLWRVIQRVKKSALVQRVMVATSVHATDDAIAEFCRMHEIAFFRGSETDVLDRYYQAAQSCAAETIVRITGDCPLIDGAVVDKVVEQFFHSGADYAANTLLSTYPDGLDTEVFSFAALQSAWQNAALPAEREHVTPYFRTSARFRIANVASDFDPAAGQMRWTVDEPRDLEFVRAIFARFKERAFTCHDVLRLLRQAPELSDFNDGAIRNEGYYKSLIEEPPLAATRRDLRRSYELKAQAQRLIPSCTQTFSKGPSQFVQGVAPVFLERASGSHVWDVDGNEYIDYPMALGPVILGHDYPAVSDALLRQLNDGVSFSLPHRLEVEVAQLLTEIIPCAEMVRFGKNGSDVTTAAVRVARAYTGREIIACCGYHGWQDWYIGTTTRRQGVPRAVQALTRTFDYNNIESLKQIFAEHAGQVAAVIMEPVGIEPPRDGFLSAVQELTGRAGALLVFDEVVSGFRLALGGAQQYFGVTPDLGCFGKALGNGLPISAIVGRRDIMKLFDEVFFSFTFGGETLSLAAARATIEIMRREPVIAHLWEQGRKLKDGFNVLARLYGIEANAQCVGLPPHTVTVFRDDDGQESLLLKSLFAQECLKRGVLFSGVQNICFSHNDRDIDLTLRVFRAAMEILAQAIHADDAHERLEGEPVQPVFRRA